MADWQKTAKAFLLADGGIDKREVDVLRAEFFSDNRIDDIELDFLLELRRDAERVAPEFHFLVIEAMKSCCLDGDTIKQGSASQLRRWLRPGEVDFAAKKYLEELRQAAKQVPPDFDQYYRQCTEG